MKRLLLTLRMAFEGIIGVLIVLHAPSAILQWPHEDVGYAVGIGIGILIGAALVWDAIRLGKSLKASVPPASTEVG